MLTQIHNRTTTNDIDVLLKDKDRNDIYALHQQLHIQTRAQAQALVDRFIPNKQVQQINNLDVTLKTFFHNPA